VNENLKLVPCGHVVSYFWQLLSMCPHSLALQQLGKQTHFGRIHALGHLLRPLPVVSTPAPVLPADETANRHHPHRPCKAHPHPSTSSTTSSSSSASSSTRMSAPCPQQQQQQ